MNSLELAPLVAGLESAEGDHYLQALRRHGFLEMIRFSKLFDLILPSSGCFLDIGANIGIYSLIMARLRPQARIQAYEPSPSCYPFLRRNTADSPAISTHQLAVSDREGSSTLLSTPHFLAGSHLGSTQDQGLPAMPSPAVAPSTAEAVPSEVITRPLNALIAEWQPAFIKMDIEGHEYAALAAATALAELPHILFVECNSWSLNWQGGCDLRRFLSLLDQRYEQLGAIHHYSCIDLKDQSNWDHFARLNILKHRYYDIIASNHSWLPQSLRRYAQLASRRDMLRGMHCSGRRWLADLSRRLREPQA